MGEVRSGWRICHNLFGKRSRQYKCGKLPCQPRTRHDASIRQFRIPLNPSYHGTSKCSPAIISREFILFLHITSARYRDELEAMNADPHGLQFQVSRDPYKPPDIANRLPNHLDSGISQIRTSSCHNFVRGSVTASHS